MSFSHVVMLCGGPDVWVRGVRMHLSAPARRQSVLALAYLVLGDGRTVAADRLADAAWPKGPPDSWRAGLRRVMSDVRDWLEAGSVDAQVRSVHGTYELVLPPDCTTDVALARDALRRARSGFDVPGEAAAVANVAVNSLANPLLPGYEAPWLSVHRREIEHEFLESLDLLADAERRRANPDAAVAAAERAIAIDPLRESSYRQAMAGHREAGRIGAALRIYETCRRVLIEEMGTAPSPATVTAYHALLDLPIERPPVVDPIGPLEEPLVAAATAMHRLESRQTIAALEARLATIDASPTPDPVQRVTTLIDLGRAHWVVEGSTEALRRISIAAGEAALSLREPEAFANALSLASTTTGIGQTDPDAADLCRRGATLFARDAALQVRVLGLQAELCFGEESIALAEQAVIGARALGDERLLLDMLLVLDQSMAWTPEIDRRLELEHECVELGLRVPPTFRRRPTFEVMTRLQMGDRTWFDELRDAHLPGTERALAWEERVFVSAMRGVEAYLLGDLEAANRTATELLVESAGELNTTHAAGGLLLAISRDSGGVAALRPAIAGIALSNERIAAFTAALATAHAIANDDVSSRAIVERFAKNGFDNVDHEHVYLLYLGLLSEAIALLDAAEHVDPMLALLEPYGGRMVVGAHGVVVLNAIDTYRGMLATVTGDGRGPGWFASARALEERMGAVLLQARTNAWNGLWCRLHGDPAEADELFAKARASATNAPGLAEMIDRLDSPA